MTPDQRAILMELCAKVAKEYDPVVFNELVEELAFWLDENVRGADPILKVDEEMKAIRRDLKNSAEGM